jgi:hypothetical protein
MLFKYKKNIRYPKILKIDDKEYHFIKRYPHYAMYENQLGIKECFTPMQVQDIYYKIKLQNAKASA